MTAARFTVLAAVILAFGAAAAPAAPEPRKKTPSGSCICTKEYRPVCGRMGDGARKTFGNECEARCAGAVILGPGRC